MGAADVVPGISGGTVALVLGIYRRLVDALRSGSAALGRFVRGDLDGGLELVKRVEWVFILPLLAGMVFAIASLANLIETQLDDHPIEIAALFLGLVASSILVAWRLLERRDPPRLLTMVAVGAVAFVLLGLRDGTSEDSVGQVDDAAFWAFFLSGAVAISAMILPGISGSLILVMIGMYSPVLDAVTGRDALPILVFVAGATLGLALFSQVLHWALHHHYDSVMAALIGLMFGSTRVLWPWPEGLDGTTLGSPDGSIPAAVTLAILGSLVVLAINTVALRIGRRSEPGLGEATRET